MVRAPEIVSVLARHGFDEILERVGVPARLRKHIRSESSHLNMWQRIRVTLEELGPTFVKLGQILSTRPDVLPEALILELRLLRDHVKPAPWEDVQKVLLEELNGPIEQFFQEVEGEAIASGSLGQVHRARRAGSGQVVAIKIQRPGIRRDIEADFNFISWFAKEIHQRVKELTPYDLPDVISEIRQAMNQELDFKIEARNATYFNQINPYVDEIFAPKIDEELSTSRVLVMDWVEGSSPAEAQLTPEQGRRLARLGGRSVFHQMLLVGFFHGDPHSGNIFITPDQRICFIDWGLAGQLTREMRYFLADLFSAIATQDAEKVVRTVSGHHSGYLRVDRTKLEKEVAFVLRKYQRFELKRAVIGGVMIELLFVFGTNGIHLARDYSLLAKAVISIEEAGQAMDPDFDLRTIAEPFMKRLDWERWNPSTIAAQSWTSAALLMDKLRDIPSEIQRLLLRLEDGDLGVNVKMSGLESMEDEIDQATNRLTLAVVVAALIIGSSLLIHAKIPPLLFGGVSAIGITGYVISALVAFWIIFDILRNGRHK